MGKKNTYSPPPGMSMHELGRAVDIDMRSEIIRIPEKTMRSLLASSGWVPIVAENQPGSWHFEFRGPKLKSVMDTSGYKEMVTEAARVSKYQAKKLIGIKYEEEFKDIKWT